jgi:hypothetical protein
MELSLVALIQYFVKTVNIAERWDMLPVSFSDQEQVSKLTGAWFWLKALQNFKIASFILVLFNCSRYF